MKRINRRAAVRTIATSATAASILAHDESLGGPDPDATKQSPTASSVGISESRARGMIVGSLLGDALGGPIEFLSTNKMPHDMPHVRRWQPGTKLNAGKKKELAATLKLRSYETLRPATAPFGPWRSKAPAGTLTDDSRHKIVVMRAIHNAIKDCHKGSVTLDRRRLAKQYLQLLRHQSGADAKVTELDRIGFGPYREAARWRLSSKTERNQDSGRAGLPPERLWAGVPNCSGQMALLPVAAMFPGKAEPAYRASYAVNFLDSDYAVDFCSAIVAGLAEIIATKHDPLSPTQRFDLLRSTMLATDPFRYGEIPFAGRPFAKWLRRGIEWADVADGDPQTLFRKLESDGEPRYWWDAHFTFLVPLSILQFCHDEPLAALNLCLDFAHDTDSYAQVMGAWIGAIHGIEVFPDEMIAQVSSRLEVDFGESVDDWCQTLMRGTSLINQHRLVFGR